MMKTLYLVRHGQTLFNARHKIQGWCDSPLTQTGIKQAQIARDYFINQGIQFDSAYCSTQERAVDTLKIITDKKIPYTQLKGLKEWNFGVYEGESEDLNPIPNPTYGDFFFDYGGEKESEVTERMVSTLTNVMNEDDSETILAVSHGGACRLFMNYWNQFHHVYQKERIGNCCIMKYEYEQNVFTLVEIINHDFSMIEK